MNDIKNPRSLSHVDSNGQANMVDVSAKNASKRTATAQSAIVFPADIYSEIKNANGLIKKGSITEIAKIAAIMAAKKTSDLIPLCHPMMIENCKIQSRFNDAKHAIIIEATVSITHKTGVEMEALTAASIGALTIYDMCKALSHDMTITDVKLLEKRGGKSAYSINGASK